MKILVTIEGNLKFFKLTAFLPLLFINKNDDTIPNRLINNTEFAPPILSKIKMAITDPLAAPTRSEA